MDQATTEWIRRLTGAWDLDAASEEQWKAWAIHDTSWANVVAGRLAMDPQQVLVLWSKIGIEGVRQRYLEPGTRASGRPEAAAPDHEHGHHAGFVDVDELTHSMKVISSSLQTIIQKGPSGYIDGLKEKAALISRNAFAAIKDDVAPKGTADTVSTIVISALNIFFGGWAARGGIGEIREANEEAPKLAEQKAAIEEKRQQLGQSVSRSTGARKAFLEIEAANAAHEFEDLEFRIDQNTNLKGVGLATSITGGSIAVQSTIELVATIAVAYILNHLSIPAERRDSIQDGIDGTVGVINVILNMIAAFGALALGIKLVQGSGPQKKRFRQSVNEAPDISADEPEQINNWRQFLHTKKMKRDNFYKYYHTMNQGFKFASTPYVAGRALETSLPIVSAVAKAAGKSVNIPWQTVGAAEISLIFTGLALFANSLQLFKGHDKQHRFVEAVNGSDPGMDTHFLQVADALVRRNPAASSPEGADHPPAAAAASPEPAAEQKTGEMLRAAFFAQINEQHDLTGKLLKAIKGKGKSAEKLETLLRQANGDYLKDYMAAMLAAQEKALGLQVEMKDTLYFPPHQNPPGGTGSTETPDIADIDAGAPVDTEDAARESEALLNEFRQIPSQWTERLQQDKRILFQIQELQHKFSDPNFPSSELERHIRYFIDLRSGAIYGTTMERPESGYKRLAEFLSDGNPEEELRRRQDIMVEIDDRARKNLLAINSSPPIRAIDPGTIV